MNTVPANIKIGMLHIDKYTKVQDVIDHMVEMGMDHFYQVDGDSKVIESEKFTLRLDDGVWSIYI